MSLEGLEIERQIRAQIRHSLNRGRVPVAIMLRSEVRLALKKHLAETIPMIGEDMASEIEHFEGLPVYDLPSSGVLVV